METKQNKFITVKVIALLLFVPLTRVFADLRGFNPKDNSEPFVSSAPPPSPIKVINIFSGLPLTGAGDNSGGYGDVAANVVTALQLAQSRPDLKINFIVISRWNSESRSLDAPSHKIVETMVPGLDSRIKDRVQRLEGINFMFLSTDRPDQVREGDKAEIESKLPKADISLMYSSDPHFTSLVRLSAPYSFLVREPGGDASNVSQLAPEKVWVRQKLGNQVYGHSELAPNPREVFVLNSGPKTLGYYLPTEPASSLSAVATRKDRRGSTLSDLAAQGISPGGAQQGQLLAFAYTKNLAPTRTYLEALIELGKSKQYRGKSITVFTKNFSGLDALTLPDNIHLVKLGAVPDSVISNLIRESDLPPLVTGDGSLSKAIAYNRDRGFLYEMNPWKQNATEALIERIKESLPKGRSAEETAAITSHLDLALKISPTENAQPKASDLAQVLQDKKLWKSIDSAIQANLSHWRLTDNILNSYDLLKKFHLEIVNDRIGTAGVSLLIKLANDPKFQTSPTQELQLIARDDSRPIEEQTLAVYALIKLDGWDNPVTSRLVKQFFVALGRNVDPNSKEDFFAKDDEHEERDWNFARKVMGRLLAVGLHEPEIRGRLSSLYVGAPEDLKRGIKVVQRAAEIRLANSDRHLADLRLLPIPYDNCQGGLKAISAIR